jgi:hypothetical protein
MNIHVPILAAFDPIMGLPFAAVFIMLAIVVAIWDGVWKMIALWKSARNGHMAWFICLAIFNTAGILPIIYILIYREKPAQQVAAA